MSSTLILFFAGYVSVFMYGFQSRNVNEGHYGLAAITSFLISGSQLLVWKEIFNDTSVFNAIIWAISGSLGITSSMYVHRRWIKPKNEKPR